MGCEDLLSYLTRFIALSEAIEESEDALVGSDSELNKRSHGAGCIYCHFLVYNIFL